ncbi:LamG-like jellyroll fold domain-containing protein [Haloferula sp.]|uniref:LamG-like jellyroll fold domain-containing protein n=1 Tax=Haloferula sp. TaxID=2497595 RepID=UPI00329F179D
MGPLLSIRHRHFPSWLRTNTSFAVVLLAICLSSLSATAHEWHDLSNIPTTRQELPGVFLDGKIYAVGGMLENPRLDSTTAFDRYDVATDTWETLPDLPISVHHVNAAVLNGKIYFMGGWTGTGPDAVLSGTYEYDPDSGIFTQFDDMPTGVAAAAASPLGDAIYVIGGTAATNFNGSGNVSLVQKFDPEAATGSQWSTESSTMPDPRNHVHSVVMDDAIYVSPGRSVFSNNSRDWEGVTIQKFYPSTSSWEDPLNLAELPATRGRSAGGLCAVNRKIYFLGGEANTTPNSLTRLPIVDLYDPAANTWTALTPEMPTGVHGMSAVTAGDRGNKIYVVAGGTGFGVAPTPKLQRMTVFGTQLPHTGTIPSLPGRIEVEDYDTGSSEVGHFDLSSGNSPGSYRSDDVDITTTADSGGGFKVTSTETGEWLEFTVNLTSAELYQINLRASSSTNDAAVSLWLDGVLISSLDLINTGDAEVFADNLVSIDLPDPFIGTHALLRMEIEGAGAELNWIEFTSFDPIGPEVESHANTSECTIELIFSEPVESGMGPGGAENPANYTIDNGVSVLSAQLAADQQTVILRTSPLSPSVNYTLLVSNVRDLASIPNTITPPASLEFVHADRATTGLVLMYQFNERSGDQVRDLSAFESPLNLSIPSPASIEWLPGALQLKDTTLISSDPSASKVNTAIQSSKALSFEAWIKPANTSQSGPARLATISLNSSARNVTLGQDGDHFEVRLRTNSTGVNGDSPALSTGIGTATDSLTHLVYTRDSSGSAVIYINGSLSVSGQIGDAEQALGWDANYKFAIGDELTGGRPWLGDIYLIALYSRALSSAEVAQNHQAGPRGGSIPPYEAWRRSHFSAAELANPLISGDQADPDGDDIDNLQEGANLLDPATPDSLLQPTLGYDPAGYLTAEFDRAFFTSDLEQGAEFSSDMNTWNKDGVLISPPTDNGDGTWRFRVRDREQSSTAARRFMRYDVRKAK